MSRRSPTAPPASRHSAITKSPVTEPSVFPASGAATIGEVMTLCTQCRRGFAKGTQGRGSTPDPVGIQQNLAWQSFLQLREGALEFRECRTLSEKRLQIQPPGLQQRGHLHPRFVHPPPVNPLHRRALENHVVDQVQRHIFRRYPQ